MRHIHGSDHMLFANWATRLLRGQPRMAGSRGRKIRMYVGPGTGSLQNQDCYDRAVRTIGDWREGVISFGTLNKCA